MSISDSVAVSIAVSLAAAPAVQSLNTPMLAAYHTHYAARFKLYSTSGGAGLAQMLLDGFTVNDAAYKAAAVLSSQNPAPANFAIGRRALPPLQSLALTFTDATVGDAYNLTIVGGQDGLSHALTYTVPPNLGTAVTGTVALVNGSAAITFSTPQTMAAGDALVFSSQPGVYYVLSAAITAATAATLTGVYQGTAAAAATSTHEATLAGTFNATNGSASVPTTTSQVGAVSPGESLMLSSQPGVYYTVAAVAAGTITLSTPYNGPTNAVAHASDVATLASAATAIGGLISALSNIGAATVAGNVVTLARTDGLLNDVQGWLANGFANIQLQNNTPDPGLATDLGAIFNADKLDWYGLLLDSNGDAEIKAAAAWTEATGVGGKVFFAATSDTATTIGTVTTDLFSALEVLGYKKTHLQQNNSQLLSYAGSSAESWALARFPGSYVLAQGMTLPGVPCDTEITLPESAALVLNAKTASSPTTLGKGGNFYKMTAGLNASFWGLTPSGQFMDLTIFLDWLYLNVQADVFAVLAGLPKVPYTPDGVGLIVDAVDTRLHIGAAAPYGGIDSSHPITVTAPNPATVDNTNVAARNLPGVAFSCFYSNGIETVQIQGTVVL